MHISEGILSAGVLAVGWAGTTAGVAISLKHTDTSRIVRTALISSAFFLASLVNVRVGPSSTHLTLLGPMGLILGWGVFPAVLVALMLQAVLFHFGGLVVLGVNTFIMGFSALSAYLVFGRAVREGGNRLAVMVLSFLAGSVAVILGAGLAGACLAMTDANFLNAAKVLVIAHIPLALIEGAVTMFMVSWLKKSAPEFLS